ncbi:MAG: hypothetical protein NVS2B16_26200 [Chloroflexota bacterium]
MPGRNSRAGIKDRVVAAQWNVPGVLGVRLQERSTEPWLTERVKKTDRGALSGMDRVMPGDQPRIEADVSTAVEVPGTAQPDTAMPVIARKQINRQRDRLVRVRIHRPFERCTDAIPRVPPVRSQ